MQMPSLNQSNLNRDAGTPPATDLSLPTPSLRSEKNQRRLWKRLLIGASLFLIVLLALAVVFHRSLLGAVGDLLVYESDLIPCDVAVVLTGGGTSRLERAIDLMQAGYAPKILMTLPNPIPEGTSYYDLFNTEKTMCQALLDFRSVPPEKIAWSQSPFHSTYSEAIFLRDWMEQNHCKSAIVVAGYFQSRRAHWAMNHAFKGGAFDIRIAAASEEFCSASDWWKDEEGIIRVENEFLKNTYYRLKGLVGTP